MSIYDGIFPALLIPMNPDYSVDIDALVEHINNMFNNGCQGAAIFGTTGECAHFSVQEKKDVLNSLIQKGIPSQRLIVGVGNCCIADTVEMIKESIKLNCLAVLWNPPFYFKNLNDEGIINFYSACLNQIEDKSTLKVILYHFPANTCVPITHNIIDKLYAAYPENILGVKDSSFSFEHTLELIQKYPQLKIYVGKDTDTSELVRHGACGAIVALSNVVPNLMRSLYDYGKDESKPNRNEEILKLWSIIGQHYLICSVKGIKASQENEHKWLVARPPLFPLSMEQAHELVRQMKEANVNK